jgi:DNA-binding NarL/FixJ family response regulator
MSVRVVLADDHRIFREGLRVLLESQGNVEVVGDAEDGRTAIRVARELSPDIVIMDIAMPDLNGIQATRQIVAEVPGVKVIALSMHSKKQFVSEMLKAGASAYLLKDCALEELQFALRAVAANRTYLSPSIAGMILEDYKQYVPAMELSVFSILSDREREVLQLVAEGKSTKEIASCLHVSLKTVETHRQQIMNKLGIHNIAELTRYAIREGLTSPETR